MFSNGYTRIPPFRSPSTNVHCYQIDIPGTLFLNTFLINALVLSQSVLYLSHVIIFLSFTQDLPDFHFH